MEISWIKLSTDLFANRKVRYLRHLPDGDCIVLIWIMLLTLAGRCNAGGLVFLTEGVPYDTKSLADELDVEENTLKLALTSLERLGMVCQTADGCIGISGWEEHQNIDGMERIREQNRKRQRAWYERQKTLELAEPNVRSNVSTDVSVTQPNATEEEKNKNKSKKRIIYSACPAVDEAMHLFVEHRRRLRSPMTEEAIRLMLKKLDGMSSDPEVQVEILQQSIREGWKGVFPLKNKPAAALDDFYSMAREWSDG